MDDCGGRLALEGRAARRQLIENGAEGVDIGRRADEIMPARRLFRRHEARRTEHLAGEREIQCAVELLREAEIRYAWLAKCIQEDV